MSKTPCLLARLEDRSAHDLVRARSGRTPRPQVGRVANEGDSMPDVLDNALQLQAGLKAWSESDRYLQQPRLQKAFRDNWDDRIGDEKFGGVWSIDKARKNSRHPASTEALKIPRENWTSKTVTVEHAIPVNVLFSLFWDAETSNEMQAVIDAYTVAVVTKQEDERLTALGLRKAMPVGWQFGDDPLVRWNMVHIEVPILRVAGR